MKKRFKIISAVMVVSVVIAGLSLMQQQKVEKDVPLLPVEKVTIETSAGQKHVVNLEVAVKPEDLERGLMNRSSMPQDSGMMFYFGEEPRVVSFWMKDTFIPLDMIFVDAEGVIASVHANAVPESLDPVSSVYPVVSVIELNGGELERRGIKPGDIVKMPGIEEVLVH